MNPRKMFLYETPGDGGSGAGVGVVDPPAGGEPAGEPGERMVPYGTMQKERRLRQESEQKLATLEAEREAARVAELSEVERYKAVAETATAEAAALKGQISTRDKSDLIRRAAKDFADPEDAVALLSSRPGVLDGVDGAEDALRVVKALATEKPHLMRVAGAPNVGEPGIAKVLNDGLNVNQPPPPGTAADDGRTLSHAELKAMTPEQMEDLERNQPKVYERSFKALKK